MCGYQNLTQGCFRIFKPKACFNPLPFKIWRGELEQHDNENHETSQMDIMYQIDDIFVHDENIKYVYNAT